MVSGSGGRGSVLASSSCWRSAAGWSGGGGGEGVQLRPRPAPPTSGEHGGVGSFGFRGFLAAARRGSVVTTYCLEASGSAAQLCSLVSVCKSRAKFAALGEVEPELSSEEEDKKKEWVAACCRNRVLSCRNVLKLIHHQVRQAPPV